MINDFEMDTLIVERVENKFLNFVFQKTLKISKWCKHINFFFGFFFEKREKKIGKKLGYDSVIPISWPKFVMLIWVDSTYK
jgi:hypothetical protein